MASIPLDFFLNNEELLKRHEQALPTKEMYRYFPPKEEIIDQIQIQKKIIVLFLMVNQKQNMSKENLTNIMNMN